MILFVVTLLQVSVSMRTYQYIGVTGNTATTSLWKNRADAAQDCITRGGVLAVMQSGAEEAAAFATIPTFMYGRAPAWIGIKDGVWADNSPVCYQNFASPSNTGGCVIMHTNSLRPRWDPWSCTVRWPYICSFGTLFPTQCNVVAGGDVHFTTLSNQLFTFNGGGDYLYSDNKHISIMTRSIILPKHHSVTSVFAAIGLKDKETNKILEIWWNGKGSENIIINSRDEDTVQNKELKGEEMKSGIIVYDVSPFLISKFPKQHRFEIQHSRFDNFYLIGYYFGRSTFTVKLPKEWNNVGLSGVGSNGEYKICHKSKTDFCGNEKTTTNKQIHEIGLSWKVSDEDTIFEKVMKVEEFETNYHDLKFSLEALERSKQICGNHQACIYDYLATGCEKFANHTRNDFSTQFTYIGDKL